MFVWKKSCTEIPVGNSRLTAAGSWKLAVTTNCSTSSSKMPVSMVRSNVERCPFNRLLIVSCQLHIHACVIQPSNFPISPNRIWILGFCDLRYSRSWSKTPDRWPACSYTLVVATWELCQIPGMFTPTHFLVFPHIFNSNAYISGSSEALPAGNSLKTKHSKKEVHWLL